MIKNCLIESGAPCSGQSSWLQIPGSIPGLYKKKKVVGLERGPLSLVSTTEELLGRNNSGCGLEIREYAVGIRHVDHVAPSIRKELALTSPSSGGRSVGIICLRTEAKDFFLFCIVSVKV
jgi:hypothetical protein